MFTELLERLARALDHAHLPYMVIGGQAVLLYGAPRLTRDIDIALGVDVDRQADVLGVATSLRITPLVDPQSFTRDTMVLPCLEPATGIRIDFIFRSPRTNARPSIGPPTSRSVTPEFDSPLTLRSGYGNYRATSTTSRTLISSNPSSGIWPRNGRGNKRCRAAFERENPFLSSPLRSHLASLL